MKLAETSTILQCRTISPTRKVTCNTSQITI